MPNFDRMRFEPLLTWGGTNTDAVLMDGGRLLAWAKCASCNEFVPSRHRRNVEPDLARFLESIDTDELTAVAYAGARARSGENGGDGTVGD